MPAAILIILVLIVLMQVISLPKETGTGAAILGGIIGLISIFVLIITLV